MISVAAALEQLFLLTSPLGTETVPLNAAAGRILARNAVARRDQPPFASSAMDGYAMSDADVHPGNTVSVIGESAAGHRFHGSVSAGQCVRIFTGAPVPPGADRIVIQEDVDRQGDHITLRAPLDRADYVRPAGSDFLSGHKLTAPRRLSAGDIALLAAMNVDQVTVAMRPRVAIMATGDELVMPGENPSQDQIMASNNFGLAALVAEHGGQPRLMPIARDTPKSLSMVFGLARDADLIVTIGGASEGDHDLVAAVAASSGLDRTFYKVAMRPGKPLMAGRMGDAVMVGLPGNAVSAMVCGTVFLIPVLRAMQGLPAEPMARKRARLNAPLAANGPREHYMRAVVDENGITACERQDSALLTVLADANALLIRPPADPPRKTGDIVEYVPS